LITARSNYVARGDNYPDTGGESAFTINHNQCSQSVRIRSNREYHVIAKDLGVPSSTLYSWVEAHQKEGKEAFPGKGYLKPSDAEIAQLKKDRAIAREEVSSGITPKTA
jgi:hypothetical protein